MVHVKTPWIVCSAVMMASTLTIAGAGGIEGQFQFARLELSARGETHRSLLERAELRAAIDDASAFAGVAGIRHEGVRPSPLPTCTSKYWT